MSDRYGADRHSVKAAAVQIGGYARARGLVRTHSPCLGCSSSPAGASLHRPAAGSSYSEVANTTSNDMTCVTYKTKNRHTTRRQQRETPAPGPARQNRYTDPLHTSSAGRRRTLAWHIARRPNGLVALAVQYGHLRTAFAAEGYASRSGGGIHDLIDMETVLAVTGTVSGLHDDLEVGGGLSGPAAQRAIKAAAHAPRFAGTVITATTARRLLANEDAMIYDNPQAFLLCHYKRSQALCHRDGVKDTRAAHAPQPVGDRLRASAARLRLLAGTHDRTRITLQETTR